MKVAGEFYSKGGSSMNKNKVQSWERQRWSKRKEAVPSPSPAV